jgi:4,5-DOPA dioxygenase extradiol
MTDLMPAIFFGHGNPMNALSRNVYTEGWASIGRSIPRPRAVLSVSAHWYMPACAVTADPAPRTIHDFGGFPRKLYEVKYPAPGSPELARRVTELLSPVAVGLDETRGLDHGTWAVLTHVFPKADIPVVQLSIDETQPPMFHYQIGKRLSALRE